MIRDIDGVAWLIAVVLLIVLVHNQFKTVFDATSFVCIHIGIFYIVLVLVESYIGVPVAVYVLSRYFQRSKWESILYGIVGTGLICLRFYLVEFLLYFAEGAVERVFLHCVGIWIWVMFLGYSEKEEVLAVFIIF